MCRPPQFRILRPWKMLPGVGQLQPMRAEALSRKEDHVGAVAFSHTGDPATGDFSDALVIRKFGDVPDDLSTSADAGSRCSQRPVFETGPGTDRRADAKFCSHRHRIEFDSRNRTKSA